MGIYIYICVCGFSYTCSSHIKCFYTRRVFVSDTHYNVWEKLLETTDEEAKVGGVLHALSKQLWSQLSDC